MCQNVFSYAYFPPTEKYFDMKKVQCKEGLDIYKKFLTRMTRISEFLKVAEVREELRAAAPGLLSEIVYIHTLHWLTEKIPLQVAN